MNDDSSPAPSPLKGSTVRSIALAAEGNREELGKVFRKFEPQLKRIIARYAVGLRAEDEEDIVQGVFAKLLERPHMLRVEMSREHAFALLCHIGIRAAIDDHRKGGKRRAQGGSALELFIGLSDDRADQIIESDFFEKMREYAFGEKSPLSPELKTILQLLLAGKADSEIVQELHVSDRTVRRRKADVQKKLKAVVGHLQGDVPS